VKFPKQDIAYASYVYTIHDLIYTMLMRIYFPPYYAVFYRHKCSLRWTFDFWYKEILWNQML